MQRYLPGEIFSSVRGRKRALREERRNFGRQTAAVRPGLRKQRELFGTRQGERAVFFQMVVGRRIAGKRRCCRSRCGVLLSCRLHLPCTSGGNGSETTSVSGLVLRAFPGATGKGSLILAVFFAGGLPGEGQGGMPVADCPAQVLPDGSGEGGSGRARIFPCTARLFPAACASDRALQA